MLPGIRLFDLTDRVALITGGSKGLGRAMAEGLASAGAKVMLVSRTAAEVDATAAQIADNYGVDARATTGDVTDPETVPRIVRDTEQTLGPVEILINSAGVNRRGAIADLSLEDFREVQRINVEATWLMCRAVLPGMQARQQGRIINVASTLGLVGLANRTPYASSKGAVVQMTRALALEVAPDRITINALCPGPFLTEMNLPIAETEEAKTSIVGAVALQRWGKLEEIQGAAIYLASDAASYTTGSMLVVDGGWTAR